MLVLLSWLAKGIAVILGAGLGYTLGFFAAFFAGDGDVGSAYLAFVLCPIGILIGSIGAYLITSRVLDRLGY